MSVLKLPHCHDTRWDKVLLPLDLHPWVLNLEGYAFRSGSEKLLVKCRGLVYRITVRIDGWILRTEAAMNVGVFADPDNRAPATKHLLLGELTNYGP